MFAPVSLITTSAIITTSVKDPFVDQDGGVVMDFTANLAGTASNSLSNNHR